MSAFSNQHVWIIGASSGIGEALAVELADQGATLILSARREDALLSLNEQLGGKHHVLPLDMSKPDEVEQAVLKAKTRVPQLDRVVALAAIYDPGKIENLDLQKTHAMLQVNLLGMMAISKTLIPVFKAQGEGQLALCGSVAGYTGLPHGQPYSATKAGVINFAETLRVETREFMDVRVINPGFVRTPMTDKNTFRMPMRIEPEAAAKAIAKGLASNRFEIHFPKAFTLLLKLVRILPYKLALAITAANTPK